MKCLKGVTDPEEKRKIIGTEFYKVFWDEVRSRAEDGYFAQGTIYPDRIESGNGKSAGKANTAVIKTHHNMVKKPDDINFIDTIEPLGDLFSSQGWRKARNSKRTCLASAVSRSRSRRKNSRRGNCRKG